MKVSEKVYDCFKICQAPISSFATREWGLLCYGEERSTYNQNRQRRMNKLKERRDEVAKKAFIMNVYPDKHQEYERRHTQLWPEMRQLIKDHGARSYSIFLDEETSQLFAYLEVEDEQRWQQAAATEINQKWWSYMADIMETNADDSPVAKDLHKVFEL